MYTGNSITNAFWTRTATKDEYFATSGSSGTSLTVYALCASNTPVTTGEQWIAYATPYYIYMSKLPITPNTVAGKTFYIYNPEKVIAVATLSKTAFLANPTTAIKNAPTIPV